MMSKTHRPMASTWWLAGCLVTDVVAMHFAGSEPINPVVALTGAVIAPAFGAGTFSPDADITWLKVLGHRHGTHRPDTTAPALTAITAVVWLTVVLLWDPPIGAEWLIWVPITGWWSHLVGDAIFGYLPVSRRLVAAGRFGLGFDTDGLLERGTRRLEARTASGLHKTKKVLPFAPTTALLIVATNVLGVAVVVQFVAAWRGYVP